MTGSFEYIFPAIRGVQAGRAFYTSMCPLHLIPKIFLFDEEEVAVELRAQRMLNKNRIPEMAQYIVTNPENYVFSAITASVDSELEFESTSNELGHRDVGRLRIPMSARFLINDGQHRRAAIEAAINEKPELGDESIAVVFFQDIGLHRSQQMFTDLNLHAVRPSRSLGLLYDHRTERAWIAKEVCERVDVFRGRIEMERSTLGKRSAKMFTLSAIETATTHLLSDRKGDEIEKRASIAIQFWNEVSKTIPEWQMMKKKQLGGGEFRQDYVCAHGLALSALAQMGRVLLRENPERWTQQLKVLEQLDWSRKNPQWEGRAMTGGRLSKSHTHIRLTTALIKKVIGVPLTTAEIDTEKAAGLYPKEVA